MFYNPTGNAFKIIYPMLSDHFTSMQPLIVDIIKAFAKCGVVPENPGEMSGLLKLMEDVGFIETREVDGDFQVRRLV